MALSSNTRLADSRTDYYTATAHMPSLKEFQALAQCDRL